MNCTVNIEDIYGTAFPDIPSGYLGGPNFNIPKVGDTFLSPHGEVCTLAAGDVVPKGPRVILVKKYMAPTERIPPVSEIYLQREIVAPEGYTLGEFRLIEAGEEMLSCYGGGPHKLSTDWRNRGYKHYRYHLIPSPTPLSIYGTSTPLPPKGYKLGVFKKLDGKDCTLDVGGGYSKGWSMIRNLPDVWRYTLIPVPPAPEPKFKVGDRITSVSGRAATVVSTLVDGYYKCDFSPFWTGMCTEHESTMTLVPAKPTQPTTAPEGYYFTGEYRAPKAGESFWGIFGGLMETQINYIPSDCRWILLPTPPKPSIPGWEAVEYRAPKHGDMYDDGFSDKFKGPSRAWQKDSQYIKQYWIMRPTTTLYTPPKSRWLVEVESDKKPEGGLEFRGYDFETHTPVFFPIISVTRKTT